MDKLKEVEKLCNMFGKQLSEKEKENIKLEFKKRKEINKDKTIKNLKKENKNLKKEIEEYERKIDKILGILGIDKNDF